MKNSKKVSEEASAFGRLGGRALVRKRGKAYMKKIAKRGAEARWGKSNNKSKK